MTDHLGARRELREALEASCQRHKDVLPRRLWLVESPEQQKRVLSLVNYFSGVPAVEYLNDLDADTLSATAKRLRYHFMGDETSPRESGPLASTA